MPDLGNDEGSSSETESDYADIAALAKATEITKGAPSNPKSLREQALRSWVLTQSKDRHDLYKESDSEKMLQACIQLVIDNELKKEQDLCFGRIVLSKEKTCYEGVLEYYGTRKEGIPDVLIGSIHSGDDHFFPLVAANDATETSKIRKGKTYYRGVIKLEVDVKNPKSGAKEKAALMYSIMDQSNKPWGRGDC